MKIAFRVGEGDAETKDSGPDIDLLPQLRRQAARVLPGCLSRFLRRPRLACSACVRG